MTRKQLSPEELDALVVRSLARLPALGPSRAFADRVMDRVQLPSPGAVVALRRSRRWLAEPRRALALAGAYAVLAVGALVLFVPWLVTHSPAIAFAYDWTVARSAAMVRDLALSVVSRAMTSGLADAFQSVPLTGSRLWALMLAAAAGYTGCAIGLHHLLRVPGGKHAAIETRV